MTQQEIMQRNQETIDELFVLINYMGNDKALAALLHENMLRLHRTNQQCLIGLFKVVIELYADTVGSDARNEDSKLWAQEVKKLNKPGFSFI